MIDPKDPPGVQIARQAKIIGALMRRAERQADVGPSAYRAFQSAIALQQKVAAQSLDLARAVTELETIRVERERTRQSLVRALSSMEEGFALFSDGRLDLCNELFRTLMPDLSGAVTQGLPLDRYLMLASRSSALVSGARSLAALCGPEATRAGGSSAAAPVIELAGDRWYQISRQQTAPDSVVLLMTDITDIVRRNRIEKETLIGAQADYLQAVFQNMSAGVCTFSASNEITMLNRRFCDVLGLPANALRPGMSLTELVGFMAAHALIARDAPIGIDTWRRELARQGRLRKRVRQGAKRVVDVHANVLPDGGIVVEVTDATLEARTTEMLEKSVAERTAELTSANARLKEQYEDKARVEDELRLAKERAEAAVSSKTRFLAAASHDLLQPINAAKLLISTLKETARETDFFAMIKRLEGAFGSAEQLLHSLLDISRLESADPEAIKPTTVSLGAIMDGIHADQSLVAEQKGVRLDVVRSSAHVRSDPIYLLRSVQNLVVNAVQYTPPGGRVLVGCRRRGGRAVLEVWDTGIGIAKKDQARIFDEFTRAGGVGAGPGMGLGLSVVDRACRLLGHSLSVRSARRRGSVFSIGMEIVERAAQVAVPRLSKRDPADMSLDHIVMAIENDRDVLYGTTKWLEQGGASVLPASSTAEALGFLTEMGMPPDIILADYQLDGGDTGLRAIREIRAASNAHVPAILITADRSEDLYLASASDDISVMIKPVEMSRLRALIDHMVRAQGDGVATERALVPAPTDQSRG